MVAGRRRRSLAFACGADTVETVISYAREGLQLDAGGLSGAFSWEARQDGRLAVSFGNRVETVHAVRTGDGVDLATPRGRFQLRMLDPFGALEAADEAGGHIRAPMPGTVIAVHARKGDAVAKGAPVLVLEAMKMEHVLRAPLAGRITALACSAGDFVTEGTELAVIEPQDAAPP